MWVGSLAHPHPIHGGDTVNYGEGLITKIYSWVWHPGNSNETMADYAGFLVLALIASFLWSTVVKAVD